MAILKWDSDDLPNCLKDCDDQYRVTHWYKAVSQYFRKNCPTGKHLRYVKFHNDCFTGSEAISWLQEELRSDKFKAELSRIQTLKILQTIQRLDKMFVDVRGKKYEYEEIADDRTLYRFCEYVPFCGKHEHPWEFNNSSESSLEADTMNLDLQFSSASHHETLVREKTKSFKGQRLREYFNSKQKKSVSALTLDFLRRKFERPADVQISSKLDRSCSLSSVSFSITNVGSTDEDPIFTSSDQTRSPKASKSISRDVSVASGQVGKRPENLERRWSYDLPVLVQEPEAEPEEMMELKTDATYRSLLARGFKIRLRKILSVKNLDDIIDPSLINADVLYENLFAERQEAFTSDKDRYPNWVLEAMYSLVNWPHVKVSDDPKAQVVAVTIMENYLKKMKPLLTYKLHDTFARIMALFLLQYSADKENQMQRSSSCLCSNDDLQRPKVPFRMTHLARNDIRVPESHTSCFLRRSSPEDSECSDGGLRRESESPFASKCLASALQVLVTMPGLSPSCTIVKDSHGKSVFQLSKSRSPAGRDFNSLVLGLPESRITEALQLCCLLLTPFQRERLRVFLDFVSAVLENGDIQVEGGGCKCFRFVRKFGKTLLRGSEDSSYDSKIGAYLFAFMMKNYKEILQKPNNFDLIVEVYDPEAEDSDVSETNLGFCSQISQDEYEFQRIGGTNAELKKLLEDISGNTRISAKLKQEQLKRFEKSYPEIYNSQFPPTAVPLGRGQIFRRSLGALRKLRL